jgi:hypothetical protein
MFLLYPPPVWRPAFDPANDDTVEWLPMLP